jgi:hypothetical protein
MMSEAHFGRHSAQILFFVTDQTINKQASLHSVQLMETKRMKFKHLAAALLLAFTSLTPAMAGGHGSLTIPIAETHSFWAQYGDRIAVATGYAGPNGYIDGGVNVAIRQAKAKFFGTEFNVRNLLIEVPTSAILAGAKVGDPNVALDGIVLYMNEEMLHMPGVSYFVHSNMIETQVSIPTRNVKILSYELVAPGAEGQ